MFSRHITIPDDLLHLKTSDLLESISMSKLARTGTSVLRRITASAQAVSVKVQGQGAMVTVSQHQYNEIVELIRQIQEAQDKDDFTELLSQRFDELVEDMNRPGAEQAMGEALFADPASLNANYRPGTTEEVSAGEDKRK
jgi:hypothetical protein